MPERPRLLFLSQNVPFPPDGGAKIRTYNILRHLARAFDITALCFNRAKGSSSEHGVAQRADGIRAFGQVETFPIPQESSRVRSLWDHLRSVARRRVYTNFVYESPSFRQRLRNLIRRERLDIVHIDSMDLAGYLPEVAHLPVVRTHHNVESLLLERRAEKEVSAVRRAYFRLQAQLMQKEEAQWCSHIALNVAVSSLDAALNGTTTRTTDKSTNRARCLPARAAQPLANGTRQLWVSMTVALHCSAVLSLSLSCADAGRCRACSSNRVECWL